MKTAPCWLMLDGLQDLASIGCAFLRGVSPGKSLAQATAKALTRFRRSAARGSAPGRSLLCASSGLRPSRQHLQPTASPPGFRFNCRSSGATPPQAQRVLHWRSVATRAASAAPGGPGNEARVLGKRNRQRGWRLAFRLLVEDPLAISFPVMSTLRPLDDLLNLVDGHGSPALRASRSRVPLRANLRQQPVP